MKQMKPLTLAGIYRVTAQSVEENRYNILCILDLAYVTPESLTFALDYFYLMFPHMTPNDAPMALLMMAAMVDDEDEEEKG